MTIEQILETVDKMIETPMPREEAMEILEKITDALESRIDALRIDLEKEEDASTSDGEEAG